MLILSSGTELEEERRRREENLGFFQEQSLRNRGKWRGERNSSSMPRDLVSKKPRVDGGKSYQLKRKSFADVNHHQSKSEASCNRGGTLQQHEEVWLIAQGYILFTVEEQRVEAMERKAAEHEKVQSSVLNCYCSLVLSLVVWSLADCTRILPMGEGRPPT